MDYDGLPARLREKIKRGDECWLWTASVGSHGYGQIHWQGTTLVAHRLVYALLRGSDLGEVLHHACDTKRCVNPAHLIPTTRANHLAGHGIGNGYGERENCINGHPWVAKDIRMRPDRRTGKLYRQCRACERERNRARRRR